MRSTPDRQAPSAASDREALVFYKSAKRKADHYQERYYYAERVVLKLRRRLRSLDPTLPNEHDGTAWMEYETVDG